VLAVCGALNVKRADAATLTFLPFPGNFFDNPGIWDLGYMPGPNDTARYTYAPGGYYITYFASTLYRLNSVEIKTVTGTGRSRFYSNPQFGASILITNRLDIYTDGTTGSDLAGMTWEYLKQMDITNSTGTAVFEIGNRGVLQMVMGIPGTMGTARVDRLICTNVNSQILIQGGELQTKFGSSINQASGNFSVGDTFPAGWVMRGGTNTLNVPNNARMYLGSAVAASNSFIEISGAGTVFTNPSCDTVIGLNAEDCRMVIRDGARAYLAGNSSGSVGYFDVGNARRARFEVTGSNTYVQLVNGFQVASGVRGTNAYVEISGGADVVATAVNVGDFGLGVFAYASTTLVTGAGSWLSGSNMNIQIGQSASANGHRLIVSSGAVVVARSLLVSQATGASNNHVTVTDGGVLRVNALSTRSGTVGYGTISNVAGVYQFRIPFPGILSGGGPISIENGTISYFNVGVANIIRSGTDFTNMTFSGTNTFQLVNSSNHPSISQSYTFSTGLGAANYSRLEMMEGGTLFRNGAATIGSGGSFMASNTTATFSSNLNITAGGFAWVQSSATVSAYQVTMTNASARLLVDGVLTGDVQISGGTVTNNGSLLGNLSLYNGTLAGTGLYSGNFTLYGGTIYPTLFGPAAVNGSILPGGNTTGTLTIVGDVTWNGSPTYSSMNDWYYQLGAPGIGDRLTITGSFTKGVGSIFRFDFGGASTLGVYTLVTWTASTTFSPSDFDYVNLGSGRGATFSIIANELVVTITTCTSPSVTPGAVSTICQGSTTGTVAFSTTGSPINYSLDFSDAANAQGFTDVLTTPLGASPLGISIPPAAAVGVYTASFTVVNAGGCRASSNFTVTVVSTPAMPGGITQSSPAGTTVCAASSGVVYSIAAVFGATNYTWTAPLGTTILSGQGTTSITLDWGSSGAGSAPMTVRAENQCGIGPDRTTSFTVVAGVPGVPTALPGTEISLNSFLVNWSAATGTVANYRLDVSTSADFSGGFVLSNLSVSGTSYFLSGLNSGETYYYRLRAENTCGASGNSASVAVLTLQLLAAWDVSTLAGGAGDYGVSPLPATTYATGHVTVVGLRRGSGVNAAGTAAARGWGGTAWNSGSAASAITAGQYATAVVEVVSGRLVSFLDINPLTYRRPAGGPTSGVLQYSVNGSTYFDITTLSYSSTSDSGGTIATPIDLSGIAALQNVAAGAPVTFRIVNYGASVSTDPWYLYDAGNSTSNDFAIRGSVCVTPTSYGLSGGGAYCSISGGIAIGLSNSQLRVSYQLYRNNGGSPVAVGSPVIGTGNAISFGTYSVADTYTAVATRDAGGCTNAMTGSVTVSVIETPNAPTDLTLFATNYQVDLTWTAPVNVTPTGYNVKRSEITGGPYITIVTNHGTESYSDTSALNGNTYYYRVSALNGSCEGSNSDEQFAEMPSGCPTGFAPTLTHPGNRTLIVPGSLTLFSLTASENSSGCSPPTLSHSTLPSGMGYSDSTLDSSRTRSYSWTPMLSQTGVYPVTVTATDDEMFSTSITFVIYVGYNESGHGGSTPPPSLTNWYVAITNLLYVSSGNSTVVWESTSGVKYDVYSSDSPIGGGATWTKVVSQYEADGVLATSDIVYAGSMRFYNVVPAGNPANGRGVWGIVRPSIPAATVSFMSPPLTGSDLDFGGTFGAEMANALTAEGTRIYIMVPGTGGPDENNDPLDWIIVERTESGWARFGGGALPVLDPGQGFMVHNLGGAASPTFSGPVGNDGSESIELAGGSVENPSYNIIGISEGKGMAASTAFDGISTVGSFDENQADQIVIMNSNGTWRRLIRRPNGIWYDTGNPNSQGETSLILMPGQAYYYIRRGGSATLSF